MRRVSWLPVVIVLGLLKASPDMQAWGDDGHQIVGRIVATKL